MSSIDYFVTGHGVIERGNFYNYMHDKGYKDVKYTREYMINSKYPFGICLKEKKIMVIESATMCYFTQRAGNLKTIEEFKEILNSKK